MTLTGDGGNRGIEHVAPPQPKTAISMNPRTDSGTVNGDRGRNDSDLAHLIEVWPDLQATVMQVILNLIRG